MMRKWQQASITAMALFALLVPGHALAGDRVLKIDPRHSDRVQIPASHWFICNSLLTPSLIPKPGKMHKIYMVVPWLVAPIGNHPALPPGQEITGLGQIGIAISNGTSIFLA